MNQKSKFAVIGVLNTLVDFGIYYAVFQATGSIVIANILGTSAALVFSFILNSRYTFQTRQWTVRNFALFIVVTLFGVWVLQTLAIYGFNHLLQPILSGQSALLGSYSEIVSTLLPKLLATGISLVWNYLWYSKVIFKAQNTEAHSNDTGTRKS
ncbi:MAG TPA: GtrA family protein [Candidatus Saccharimonadales bacterium]